MLVAQTGETAHLGVLRDGEVVSLINVESGQTLRTPSTVGARTPAHCTSLGKAILAFVPLRTIRERGYSIDNEEREQGLRCIGAPVYDSSGEVVAAVGIAGPAFRITDKRLAICSTAVMDAANKICGTRASLTWEENVEREYHPAVTFDRR